MKVLIAIGLLALSSCAASPDRTTASHPIYRSYDSAKDARSVATCLQKAVAGSDVVLAADGGFVVASRNTLGTIVLAWYVAPRGSGSKIDVRRAQTIANGVKRAEVCF